MKTEFDLKLHLHRLLSDEPFFSAISRRVNKSPSRGLPTAGVTVDKDTLQFKMLYNPDFFKDMEENKIKGVLMHEFYHLIFKHVTSRKPENVPHLVWNIAGDLAINSMIGENNLPEGCCIPGGKQFEDYPLGKTAEFYLEMMKDDENFGDGKGGFKDLDGQSGSDFGNFDDHSGWEEGEGGSAAADIAKEKLKEAMKAAAEESASGRGFGSCEGNAKKLVMDAIKPKVDWKKVLRSFVNTSVRANRKHTVKRINKRFPYIHAGSKVKREAKIAVCIDQSGSVDDGMLVKFYAELNKLCDLVSFDIIPFDSSVGEKHIYTWKKGQKRNWERVMFGGTCFDAPTKYVNENKYDGMVVLTDMLAPKPKRESNFGCGFPLKDRPHSGHAVNPFSWNVFLRFS